MPKQKPPKTESFVKVFRSDFELLDDPSRNESFSRFEALCWLRRYAAWEDQTVSHGGLQIPLTAGQLLTTKQRLSKVWRRDVKTADAWLIEFQSQGKLLFNTVNRRGRGAGYTIITFSWSPIYSAVRGKGMRGGTGV